MAFILFRCVEECVPLVKAANMATAMIASAGMVAFLLGLKFNVMKNTITTLRVMSLA